MLPNIVLIALVLCVSCVACGQSIDGYTSIDVDQSSYMVTATCETDLDSDGEATYMTIVTCQVVDDNGNVISSGGSNDLNTDSGVATATLTFTGKPGTNYTATGQHSAEPLGRCPPDDEGDTPLYYDPFNFESFAESPETYLGSYEWYGPGPEQQIPKRVLHVGSTTATSATTPVITIHFSGEKTSGDSLTFGRAGVCSETLGPIQCSDFFHYSYEGQVAVSNASKWTVSQTLLGSRTKNSYSDGTTSNTAEGQHADGPGSSYLQEIDGVPVFWLDSPGTPTSVDGISIVTSKTSWNFSVQVCSSITPSICSTLAYYTTIIVANGTQSGGSPAGPGSTSLSF